MRRRPSTSRALVAALVGLSALAARRRHPQPPLRRRRRTRSPSSRVSARRTPTSWPTGRATTSRRACATSARTPSTSAGQPVAPRSRTPTTPNCTPLRRTGSSRSAPASRARRRRRDYLSHRHRRLRPTDHGQAVDAGARRRGKPTGQHVAGAVTVTLTADQAQRARSPATACGSRAARGRPAAQRGLPASTASGRCAAPSTTSTATTSSGSASRPAPPRLLLLLRGQAAAERRHDRGAQVARGAARTDPAHVPLRRQHLLHDDQRLLRSRRRATARPRRRPSSAPRATPGTSGAADAGLHARVADVRRDQTTGRGPRLDLDRDRRAGRRCGSATVRP